MSSTHDAFISFSFKDQDTVNRIVNELLTKYGITSWLCLRELEGGSRYKYIIPDAIRSAGVVVFIQSENSLRSEQIPKEIDIACDAGKTIIPFKLDNSSLRGMKLEYDLLTTNYIDGTVPTMEERIRDLAVSVSAALGKSIAGSGGAPHESVLKSNLPLGSGIFAGRDGVMRDIDSALAESGTVFLCGMGGIGKSELALQYANRKKNAGEYDTVVFAYCESSLASLLASDEVFGVRGTARRLRADGAPESDEEYAREKLRSLKSSADARTLIILDNFDIPEDELFDELASGAPYRVIVTSRREPDRKKYRSITVGELDDEVLKRLFIEYADSPRKTDITTDDKGFDELFRITGRHTQTLELIAKFMMLSEDIFYLDEMTEYLRENGFGAAFTDVCDGVEKIFSLSSLSEKEKQFLSALAMMPQAGVNQRKFKKWLGDAFSARALLADRSLVKINGEARSIYLHPVVREVVIKELAPSYSSCREFADRCAMVGEDVIPLMWMLGGEEKLSYFACLKSILSFIPEITRESYALFCNASHMYNYVGSYEETDRLHDRIYSFACREFGEDSEEAMLALGRRAWKRSNLRMYREALPPYKKAAEYFINFPDYGSREAQSVIQNCGSVCFHLCEESGGREYLDAARYYFDSASEYGRHMETEGSEDETWRFNMRYQNECIARDYGKLYMYEGDRARAEECFEKYRAAVESFEKAMHTETADRGDPLEKLGRMRFADGRYAEALALYEPALGVFEKFFDEYNPRIILLLEEIAACRTALGEYDKAKERLTEAVRRAEHTFTDTHPVLLRLRKLQNDAERKADTETQGEIS